jgi:hypothetical protein
MSKIRLAGDDTGQMDWSVEVSSSDPEALGAIK